MGRHRRAVTLLVLSCALVAVTAVAVGAPPGTSPGVESGDGSTEAVLVERVEIHSVSEGDVTATLVYELPPSLKSLSVRIETGDVETVDTNGFEEWGDQRYGWIDNETTASVTVRYDVTEGFNLDEWFDAPVDGGEEWGIVTRPQTETMWSSEEDASIMVSKEFVSNTTGVAGEELAYVGNYTLYKTGVAGQHLRLVVPENAALEADPSAIVESVAWPARRDIGPRSDSVLFIAAPSEDAYWEPGGLAVDSDIRIADDARTDAAVNAWVHEYVHERQSYMVDAETRWLVEGSAQYYGLLANLNRGVTDFDTFAEELSRGETRPQGAAILAQPNTWQRNNANYHKGALVVAKIDYEIRNATDGNATFDDVMARWARQSDFGQREFEAAIKAVGGEDVAASVMPSVESMEAPTMWTREDHREVFGNASDVAGVETITTITPKQSPTTSGSTTTTASRASPSATTTPTTSQGESGPGFGPIVGLAAFGTAVLLWTRRDSEGKNAE